MSERTERDACTRRTLLKAGAGATALAATGASGTALAQEEPYDGYLSDANGYNGTTAEYTDTDSVTVEVGAGSDGLGFNLPAIKIPSGTTVTWEWTGEGGTHNVVANDETFNSGDPIDSADETFEYTFEEEGAYTYFCSPHEALGMKGVVVVGDNAQGEVAPASEVEFGGGDGDGDGGEDGGEDGGGSADFDFGGYLDDANLYEGSVEDLRGESDVTVMVGAGNGFAFDPPAIRIDPETTVTWEWTGEGGGHNVIARDDTFNSGDTQTSGTFEYTFEEEATHTYFCEPHEGAGMKGAVVVGEGGDVGGGEGSGEETAANETALQTLLAMLVLGLLSPIVFLLFVRRRMSGPPRPQ